ncbi:MAG TPA: NUDIX hydrolase [Pseudonocardia sp.]|nr:NUDIX hydrolase [Pseudonocardia sp.]
MLHLGDGDGWARCGRGHRHWGVRGAAGLLLRHGDHVLLQHRAPWSHHGSTWGLLGGARRRTETPEQAAQREAEEEAGVRAGSYAVVGCYVDDHGGWSYTTVVGRVPSPLVLTALTAETVEVRWVAADRIGELPLHPGFAATWERVRAIA